VVEHLPSFHEALGSIPNKRKRGKEGGRKRGNVLNIFIFNQNISLAEMHPMK
jgi:hypothetical protein